jgi:putative DNA primase/helicase
MAPHSKTSSVADIAASVLNDAHFARDRAGRLYHYSDGVYVSNGEHVIRRAVKDVLKRWREIDDWSRHIVEEVIAFIGVDAPFLWERPPLDLVNVQNGLLETETGAFRPHTPDHLTTVQIAANFIPGADCEEWEGLVDRLFPSDSHSLAWEIAALLMTPFTDLQKAILLLGEGGNGKSTFLTGLTNFLGQRNVSSVSLQSITKDRFAGARLYGKLANICADLPSEHLKDTSVFKRITGGDLLTMEEKFRTSFDYVPFARLIFSANRPPFSDDGSEAYFDRWIVVPFQRKLRGAREEIQRNVIDARLAQPSELSGLLNKALQALPAVTSRGLTVSGSTRDAKEEFVRMTSPLSYWLSEETLVGSNREVSKANLYTVYCDWCERHGVAVPTAQKFGHAIAKLRPGLGDYQKGAMKTWYYKGIGLKKPVVSLSA